MNLTEPGSSIISVIQDNFGMIAWLFALIIILLFLSALNSGLEMALAGVNRIKIKAKVDNDDKKAIKVLKLIETYPETSTTIIVFNNVVNILLASISSAFFITLFPVYGVLVSTIIMTILILIFGEIIPKIYGRNNAESMLTTFAGFLNISKKILRPIVYVFLKFNNRFQRNIKTQDDEQSEVEDELLAMIEESEQEGTIDEEDSELIKNAIDFNDTRVSEILTPFDEIISVDVTDSHKDILELFKEEKYSRIPVYEEDSSNIIGLLYERDFFNAYIEDKNFDLKSILREAIFTPDSLKISKLLVRLQNMHNHMTIIVDERGTVIGLCTIEDIIEELVGEIWDEHDDVELDLFKLSENKYEISGDYSISDFNDIFDEVKDIESETDEDTLAGYVIEIAEKIPDNGEVIKDEFYKYIINSDSNKKINSIIVEKK